MACWMLFFAEDKIIILFRNKQYFKSYSIMSTRWYPIYQKGNPQLRVFLPNFWMKLVRPERKLLPNVVQFQCSMEMTKHDVQNYLQKIYNVPVVQVRTRIALGKFRREPNRGFVVKDDDIKYAYVVMPKNQTFQFPEIFEGAKDDKVEHEKSLEETKKNFRTFMERNKHRSDVPSWFSI